MQRVIGFLVCWMTDLPAYHRKWLSYYGGIQRRVRGPCPAAVVVPWSDGPSRTYHPTIQESVFDPGNWVYYFGTRLLMPRLLDEWGWNAETVGDFWESVLGDGALSPQELLNMRICRSLETLSCARSFGRWIDAYMYSVYRFCLLAQIPVWSAVSTIDDCYAIVQDRQRRSRQA